MEEKKKRAAIVIGELKKLFPEAKIELHFSNPFELLVATILSAQTTDKTVNKVTEPLFQKYKTVDDYAKAGVEEFDHDIRSVNFHHNKAKNIIAAAQKIKIDYSGKVPQTMEELLTLPGVARKTANVVLGVAFHKSEGIVVDTHVIRLSQLLGLTEKKEPVKIEQDLMQIVPRDEWIDFSLRMILYGRTYCPARPHNHANCPLTRALTS